jgi:hypothetical protein
MTNDLQRALDIVADSPTQDFVARLATEIELEMTRTTAGMAISHDLYLLEVPTKIGRTTSARTRVWRTTAVVLASAAVIAVAVAVANPFSHDASPIYTGSTLTETTTPPEPTVAPTSAITSSPTKTEPPETTASTTLVSAVPPIPIDRWEVLPDVPGKPMYKPLVVALGTDVLVVGGYETLQADETPATAGAVFDGKSWRAIPDAPVPVSSGTSAVWTGSNLLVVSTEGTILTFTPGPDRWEVVGKAPQPNRFGAQVDWTGDEMLFSSGGVTGLNSEGGMNVIEDAVAYRPSTKTWRAIPRPPTKDPLTGKSVWTGTQWVRTVGWNEGKFEDFGAVAAYDPTSNRWRELPQLAASQPPTAILMEGEELVAYTTTERWRLDGEAWVSAGALPLVWGYNSGFGEAWFVNGQAIRTKPDASSYLGAPEALDARGIWEPLGEPFPEMKTKATMRAAGDRFILISYGKAARLRMP